MPKIEVDRSSFFAYLGKSCSDSELETLLSVAKAELDESTDSTIKIELNDTNRPDLWSATGLARLLRIYESGVHPEYPFFSSIDKKQESGNLEVKVDANLKEIRPYVVAFVADEQAVDEAILNDIIQTQEKLCWNFGQKRKAIAMGVYRSDRIHYPVHYRAVDPDKTRFIPLGFDKPMSLREINTQHPKGQEYGHIVANYPLFPLLCDDNNDVLSYPPVINSAGIGAVTVGTRELFIELTGGDMKNLLLAASIVACNLADGGFTIRPVRVNYPFDTEFGRQITIPYYFQEPQAANITTINKLLGIDLSRKDIQTGLVRMGNRVEFKDDRAIVRPPAYRNDFLHEVDVVEDVMIGRGLDSFIPELPHDPTLGRLTKEEEFMRRVRDLLVGLGFQEMIFNYLGATRDHIYRMHPQLADIQSRLKEGESLDDYIVDSSIIHVLNPMSENYAVLRNSILPNLLHAESISGQAAYPHNIFEVGKTTCLDADEVYGTRSKNTLAYLVADKDAGFNLLSSQISTFFYYINRDYRLEEIDDQRFIPGRAAMLMVKNQCTGIFGELHPGVLDNWSIDIPVSACEIDLDILLRG